MARAQARNRAICCVVAARSFGRGHACVPGSPARRSARTTESAGRRTARRYAARPRYSAGLS
ncbi:hypothetical protein L810_4012 [Burkholderia sp. AU4i]|nr:hypothetical protein L810_4012 [Burkholderia sp. AU4i]MDW9247826.1 hypothetical protein [Burkholderia cepacia]